MVKNSLVLLFNIVQVTISAHSCLSCEIDRNIQIQSNIIKYCLIILSSIDRNCPMRTFSHYSYKSAIWSLIQMQQLVYSISKSSLSTNFCWVILVVAVGSVFKWHCYIQQLLSFTAYLSLAICYLLSITCYMLYFTCFLRVSISNLPLLAKTCFLSLVVVHLVILYTLCTH